MSETESRSAFLRAQVEDYLREKQSRDAAASFPSFIESNYTTKIEHENARAAAGTASTSNSADDTSLTTELKQAFEQLRTSLERLPKPRKGAALAALFGGAGGSALLQAGASRLRQTNAS